MKVHSRFKFLGALLSVVLVISATKLSSPAIAQANAPEAGPGAFILNPTRAYAVSLEAGGQLNLPAGTLYVFSSSPLAIVTRDLGSIQARSIAQNPTGGIVKDSKVIAQGQAELPAIADPLKAVPLPDLAGLKSFGDVELKTERVTLQPGIYDSLIVGGLAQVQLAPGVYVFKNEVEISSQNGVQGQNVTLINQGRFVLNGNGKLRISAPNTGPFKGIAFYQESANKKTLLFESNAQAQFLGTLYLPSAYLHITGNGEVACTRLFADSLRLSANGKLLIQ